MTRSAVRSRLAPPAFARFASYGWASHVIAAKSEGCRGEARRAKTGSTTIRVRRRRWYAALDRALLRRFRHHQHPARALSQPSRKCFSQARSATSCRRGRQNAGGAAGRPADRGGRGRAWSSDASSRRSRRDETESRTHVRIGTPASGSRRLPPVVRCRRKFKSFAVPVIDLIGPMRAKRQSGRASDGSDNSRSATRPCGCGATGAPSCLASICAPRQMPRNGRCSRSGTAIQSISRRTIIVGIVGAHRAAENDGAGVRRRAFPAAGRQSADAGCRADARAPATRCRRGPASRFPGAGRSEPAAESAPDGATGCPCQRSGSTYRQHIRPERHRPSLQPSSRESYLSDR